MLQRLFGKDLPREAGRDLCVAVTRAARAPAFFGHGRTPDTFEGRFEVVALMAALVLRRLAGRGEQADRTSQALFDTLFRSFDQALRDVGVGDLSVGKRIRKMAEAFYGRAGAYRAALDAGDMAALADALDRNLLAGSSADPGFLDQVVVYTRHVADALDLQSDDDLLAGRITFPPLP